MEEQKAIARLKRGDIGGLEALVRKYQVQAVRTAYLITRDRALAEDIVQAACGFGRGGRDPPGHLGCAGQTPSGAASRDRTALLPGPERS